MKKYIPSVKSNNQCREEVANELSAVIYRLEKGRYDAGLDAEKVSAVAAQMKERLHELAECIGTGTENIGALSDEAQKQIRAFKKAAAQPMTHRFEEAADELGYTLVLWKDVLDGSAVLETEEEIAKARESRMRRKLGARLAELEAVKTSFTENDKRLEREISGLESDLAEYEHAMLGENNERHLNELYRNIKAAKSKIDMLNVRHSNYSACYNLLDMIYVNAREILQATDYAGEEVAKAKAFLDIDKLKKVVVDPDRAIVILKQMDKDIKGIASRAFVLDENMFGLNSGGAAVSGDALAYKEELMRKQREKEALKQTEMIGEQKNNTEVNGNGIL